MLAELCMSLRWHCSATRNWAEGVVEEGLVQNRNSRQHWTRWGQGQLPPPSHAEGKAFRISVEDLPKKWCSQILKFIVSCHLLLTKLILFQESQAMLRGTNQHRMALRVSTYCSCEVGTYVKSFMLDTVPGRWPFDCGHGVARKEEGPISPLHWLPHLNLPWMLQIMEGSSRQRS